MVECFAFVLKAMWSVPILESPGHWFLSPEVPVRWYVTPAEMERMFRGWFGIYGSGEP